MPNYDFLNLSPAEFEELSRDLLQKHLGVYLESFTQGKDKGIDLRYSSEKTGSFIVQCKRYKDFDSLKTTLKKEAEKVKILNPGRYILVTSVGLTPANKDEIVSILNGYIKTTSDIFGKDDLNNLLGNHSDIVKRNYKLWLSSVEVLERILHSDIIGRSEFELEDILRTIRLYVQNQSYTEAINFLNDHNYVIISGIPGIGKTTLAKMICCQYVATGYELIVVSGDINEAEKLIKKESRQVFYYDDFLGTNFLEAGLIKNEDKRILRFIETVTRINNKKLILTTREYILNQARIKYELLTSKKIDISKCIIDLSKYTKRAKAQILYNHLSFYNVPSTYIDSLLHKKRYFLIINHPNYNPRAIEFMAQNINEVLPEDYFDHFMSNLNNPIKIWEHSFENQITAASRYVLYALLISNGETSLEVLEKTFDSIIKETGKKYSIPTDINTFQKSIKELENTFIKTNSDKQGTIIVVFQNPSVQDFLVNYLQNNLQIVQELIHGASYFNQLIDLYNPSYEKSEHKVNLPAEIVDYLINIIMNKFDMPSFALKYSMTKGDSTVFYTSYELSVIDKLFELAEVFDLNKHTRLKKYIADNFKNVITNKIRIHNTGAYLKLLEKLQDSIDDKKAQAIILYISNMDDIPAIEDLEKLEELFPEDCALSIESIGKDRFIENLEEIIHSDIDSYSEYDDGLVDDLKHRIRLLSHKYGTDHDYFDDILQEKLDATELHGDPNDLEDYGGTSVTGSDDKYIEDLFNSLNQ